MSYTPIRVGKCSKKVQGKIIVKLETKNLPKIGARVKIQRNGHFKTIGGVIEVIGSTRNPWIVISASPSSFNIVQYDENIFTEERSQREKKKKKRKVKRHKKKEADI
ncbi:MAG: hypothetical protein ACFFB5_21215 [Promethearchaeota archaeon]